MDFPRVTIDADALRNNLGVVRRFAPHSRIVAAIKANAYGHGLLHAARALADADAFGLARIAEALQLRAAGIGRRLVLLEGVVNAEDLNVAATHQLDIVVHCLEQVSMLESFVGSHRFDVWLKLDSGMHRIGLAPEEFADAHRRLSRTRAVHTITLMTHLAMAEALDSQVTPRQLGAFNAATSALAGERSIANSAGLIGWPETRVDWVRPGIMLYGVSPMANASAAELGLRPAMTLTTRLIAVNRVRAGETVGYAGRWRAERDSIIGVAAIGYGDGYPRQLPNGSPVLVNGCEAKLAGRVSMDMIAIDVTDLRNVQIGDDVVLWGSGLSLERVADAAGTIGYELACRVSDRVRRIER